jgi:uncharacterized protein YecT (DUF1311 family)
LPPAKRRPGRQIRRKQESKNVAKEALTRLPSAGKLWPTVNFITNQVMLRRICLVVAILAALAAGGLNFVKVKEKITTLVTERNDWHTKFTTADADLNKAKKNLVKTEADLKQTKDTLVATTAAKDAAVKKADAETKRASELADKLTKTVQEREEAKAELSRFTGTGLSVERILAFDKDIKQTKAALDEANVVIVGLQRELTKTKTELAKYKEFEYIVPLPPNLKGMVVVTDPKWDFVVLDVGEDQGVLPDSELLVNRNGKLVAKVRVTSVQKDRCIANVVPGWKLGEVIEGDQVIPAHPAS